MTSQWVSSLTTTSKGMSLIHDGSYSDICQRLGSLLCNDGLLELSELEKNKLVVLTFTTTSSSSGSSCGDMYDLCHDLLTCPEMLSVICYTKIFDFLQHLILYGPTQSSLVNAKRLILPLFDVTHVGRNYRTFNTALQQPTNLLHKVMGGRVDRGAPVRHASNEVYTLLTMDDASLIHKRDTLLSSSSTIVTEQERHQYLQQQIKRARQTMHKNQQLLHPTTTTTVGGYGSGTERVVGAAHSLEDMLQLASQNQQKKKHSYRDQPTQPTEQELREQETIRKLQFEVQQQQQQQQQQQPPPDIDDLFGFPTTTTTPTPTTTVVATPQQDLMDFTSTTNNTDINVLDVPTKNTEVDILGLQVESTAKTTTTTTTTSTTNTNYDLLNWDTPTIPTGSNDNKEQTHSIFDIAPSTTTTTSSTTIDAVRTNSNNHNENGLEQQPHIMFDYLATSDTTNNNSILIETNKATKMDSTLDHSLMTTVEVNSQVPKNIMNNNVSTTSLAMDDLVASLSTISTTNKINEKSITVSSPTDLPPLPAVDPPPLPPPTMDPPSLPPPTMDPPSLPSPTMDLPSLPPPTMDPPSLPPPTMDLPPLLPEENNYDATDGMDAPVMGGTINVAPIPSFPTTEQPQTPLSMQDMMEQLQKESNMSPEQMQKMMQSMMQMMMQQQQMNNHYT